MNWDVIIKWLPRLTEGALLTLELVAIAVTSVLQTSAGRMVFGRYESTQHGASETSSSSGSSKRR